LIVQQCRTQHAWFLEPGITPGKRFHELLLHTSHTKEYSQSVLGYFGEIFSRKRLLTRLSLNLGRHFINENFVDQLKLQLSVHTHSRAELIYFPDLRTKGSPIAEHLLEVDTLHGMWFLKTKWMFGYFSEVSFSHSSLSSRITSLAEEHSLPLTPPSCGRSSPFAIPAISSQS
jgi:hypothetical protein